MRNPRLSLRHVSCCAAIILTFTKAEAQNTPQQVLLRIEQTTTTLKSLYARLREEQQDKQIGGREIYEAEIYIKRIAHGRDKGRIEYKSGQVVFFDDGKVVFNEARVMPASDRKQQGKIATSEELQFFTTQYTQNAASILNRYKVALLENDNNSASAVLIELTPKDQSELSRIRWWINKADWLPFKVEFNRTDGTRDVFVMRDIKKNIRIEGDVFLSPPKLSPLNEN